MSNGENVITFAEKELGLELAEFQKRMIRSMFDHFDKYKNRENPNEDRDQILRGDVELWRQIPDYAEFEVSNKGEVRNVLTKISLKPTILPHNGKAVYLRNNAGRKALIKLEWARDMAFPEFKN